MLAPLKLNQSGLLPFLNLLDSLRSYLIKKSLSGEGQITFFGLMFFFASLIQSPIEPPYLGLFFI
jgi:hypothetical protein